MNSVYICIDLKSFYASVECAERNLNPLTTNLVVADVSRTQKTICLAVSPSLKAFGIPGRERLFNVIKRVKEVNRDRFKANGYRKFIKKSCDANELKAHPEYELDYIAATPQMAKYIKYSTKIYDIYLKYVAKEDIHVYSIDEVFMDVTKYLKALNMTPYQMAKAMIMDVLKATGVTATAGIGTNMYLAKVAMDITAKHMPADEYGVRVAELDEMSYRKLLWTHEPLTDFWRVGPGYVRRLHELGLYTMGDIALCSEGKQTDFYNEDLLYKEFGVNAELLIDHAWGYEPTTIADIKAYKPDNHSLNTGQVLHEPYPYKKARLIVKEMVDLLALDLTEKGLVTDSIGLYIGYDIENLSSDKGENNYKGSVEVDYIGRKMPKASHGGIRFNKFTQSSTKLTEAVLKIFDRVVDPSLTVRRVNITAGNILPENEAKVNNQTEQLSLFTDYSLKKSYEEKDDLKEKKDKDIQKALVEIKKKYGKNSVLKGMNYEEGATTKERNEQIGGHKA